MKRLKTMSGVGAGLAAALLLAGCGTTLTLNDDNLEAAITTWIADQGAGDATVICPEDRPLQQGDTFQCVATYPDGSTDTLQVTQTDNAGNVTWQVL